MSLLRDDAKGSDDDNRADDKTKTANQRVHPDVNHARLLPQRQAGRAAVTDEVVTGQRAVVTQALLARDVTVRVVGNTVDVVVTHVLG